MRHASKAQGEEECALNTTTQRTLSALRLSLWNSRPPQVRSMRAATCVQEGRHTCLLQQLATTLRASWQQHCECTPLRGARTRQHRAHTHARTMPALSMSSSTGTLWLEGPSAHTSLVPAARQRTSRHTAAAQEEARVRMVRRWRCIACLSGWLPPPARTRTCVASGVALGLHGRGDHVEVQVLEEVRLGTRRGERARRLLGALGGRHRCCWWWCAGGCAWLVVWPSCTPAARRRDWSGRNSAEGSRWVGSGAWLAVRGALTTLCGV